MKNIIKWILRSVILLVIATILIGLWKRDEITRLMAVNSLFDQKYIVSNFSNMHQAFLHRDIPKGTAPVAPLPKGPEMSMPSGYNDWVKARTVTSTLVMKNGAIVFEDYFQGTTEHDRRISWSMAKSYLSALFGILVDEGAIASLDDKVTKYVPALADSAYEDATILNVLQMSSGITFNEDYLDKSSDINRMGRVLALGGKMDDFAAGLVDQFAPAGKAWQYTSIDTHVIGMVARGATGRNIPDLMAEKLIGKLGMEQTPYYVTDGAGVSFVLGGLNITTRDYARFAQMIAQNGMWQGEQIVPAAWIQASTVASAPTQPGAHKYGYQWWVPAGFAPGQFMAWGVYGQYIYIDQIKNVVIVSTAADRKFREAGVRDGDLAMFQAIAAATE